MKKHNVSGLLVRIGYKNLFLFLSVYNVIFIDLQNSSKVDRNAQRDDHVKEKS